VDDDAVNPEWLALKSVKNTTLGDLVGAYSSAFIGFLNSATNQLEQGEANTNNTHFNKGGPKFELNGSSFDLKGGSVNQTSDAAIFAAGTRFQGSFGAIPFNPVGSSSWFYQLTPSNDNLEDPVLVDEFDNLKHDAYWGLAKADNGDLILSYTMESAIAKATSLIGLQRRNLTDFSALYGSARVLASPVDEFTGWAPSSGVSISAVPEPSTYGLFAIGLLALGLRARRQAAA
jgi:hypothetical protein